MQDPWRELVKGEQDEMALHYLERGKWCSRQFQPGWLCNRVMNHEGHHVASDSEKGMVWYIERVIPPELHLPPGF